MRLTTIKVPDGCKEIAVDVEDGKVIVSFLPGTNGKEFFCKETDCVEEKPGVGDFAIFWDEDKRKKAVVANLEKINSYAHYVNSEGGLYNLAIKFRNYEQYLKVRGKYVENEP